MNIMNKKFTDLYGSNENSDKSILWVGLTLLIVMTALLLLFFLGNIKIGLFEKTIAIYFFVLFFEMSLLMIALYYFHKKEGKDKWKIIRYSFIIFSLLLFSLTFFPFAIALFLLDKAKFYNVYRYVELYSISVVLSLFVTSLTSIILYLSLSVLLPFSNPAVITLTFAFIANYLLMRMVGSLYFKLKIYLNKRKMKKSADHQIYLSNQESLMSAKEHLKKELYVFNFVIIAFGSTVVYFINFAELFNISVDKLDEFRNGLLYSFALYTAFDRLKDKWSRAFKIEDDKKKSPTTTTDLI
jgi:hypothetical protein